MKKMTVDESVINEIKEEGYKLAIGSTGVSIIGRDGERIAHISPEIVIRYYCPNVQAIATFHKDGTKVYSNCLPSFKDTVEFFKSSKIPFEMPSSPTTETDFHRRIIESAPNSTINTIKDILEKTGKPYDECIRYMSSINGGYDN